MRGVVAVYKIVGTFVRFDHEKKCPICKKIFLLRDITSKSFYVTFSVQSDIKELLERNSKYYDHVVRVRVHERGIYRDIYDGKAYRDFVDSLDPEFKTRYVSFVFNSDGAAKFESSTFSAYPIYILLNEIPMDIRTSEPIICALWFGKGKPDMNVFLRVFVEEMNKMANLGISCIIQGESRIIKPYAICCCVDSVARAPMQGITQYNGRYGCSWCHHEGKYIRNSTGTGGSRKFPFLNPLPQERTEESMLTLPCLKFRTNFLGPRTQN